MMRRFLLLAALVAALAAAEGANAHTLSSTRAKPCAEDVFERNNDLRPGSTYAARCPSLSRHARRCTIYWERSGAHCDGSVVVRFASRRSHALVWSRMVDGGCFDRP